MCCVADFLCLATWANTPQGCTLLVPKVDREVQKDSIALYNAYGITIEQLAISPFDRATLSRTNGRTSGGDRGHEAQKLQARALAHSNERYATVCQVAGRRKARWRQVAATRRRAHHHAAEPALHGQTVK